jgi:hypothetical protein
MVNKTLKTYLSSSFLDKLKNSEEQKKIQKVFMKKRVLVIKNFLKEEGLKKLRSDFDKLKKKEEKAQAGHKNIFGLDSKLVEEQACVSALIESKEFQSFLQKITGFENLRIRDKKRANINISSETGQHYEWHFDGEGITVIFPLEGTQKKNGGAFAYYPLFRKHHAGFFNKAFTKALYTLKLHRVLLKEERIYYEPGTLVVFDGDTTYHSAMPLLAKDYRRIVILHYTKK